MKYSAIAPKEQQVMTPEMEIVTPNIHFFEKLARPCK